MFNKKSAAEHNTMASVRSGGGSTFSILGADTSIKGDIAATVGQTAAMSKRASSLRVDQLLVDRGLAESRTRAQALILAGKVFSGDPASAGVRRGPAARPAADRASLANLKAVE